MNLAEDNPGVMGLIFDCAHRCCEAGIKPSRLHAGPIQVAELYEEYLELWGEEGVGTPDEWCDSWVKGNLVIAGLSTRPMRVDGIAVS